MLSYKAAWGLTSAVYWGGFAVATYFVVRDDTMHTFWLTMGILTAAAPLLSGVMHYYAKYLHNSALPKAKVHRR